MKRIIQVVLMTALIMVIFPGNVLTQATMFVKNVGNNSDIYLMPDADYPLVTRQLTSDPGIDNHPDFHIMPNNDTMVVWSSNRAPGNNFEIYSGMLPDLDASAVRLTFNNYPDRHPHLSHSGMWIVCTGKYRFEPSVVCPKSECSIPVNEPCGWYEGLHIIDVGTGVIYEIDLRSMSIIGGGVWPNLFSTWVGHPSFSHDDSKIIFSAAVDEGGTDWEVYTLDWSPPNIVSNLTRITQGTVYPPPPNPIQMSAGAEFASMDAEIVYSSTRTPTGNSQIFKIPATSVNQAVNPFNQMTWNYGNDYVPEELSDGRILLTSDLGPTICPPPAEGASADLDLWLINSNGSGRVNLTDNDLNDEMLLLGDEVSWFCGIKPNLSECTYYPKIWNVCWWKEFYRMGTNPSYLPSFPKRAQYTQAWQFVTSYMNNHDPGYFNSLMTAMNQNWNQCEESWLNVQSWWIVPTYYPGQWDFQMPAKPELIAPANKEYITDSFFDIDFDLSDIPGATSYGIEIYTGPPFTAPAYQQSGLPASEANQLLPAGRWYWRASATNAYGTSWSTVNYFTIQPPNIAQWNGSVSDDWFNSVNWSPPVLPGPSTDVIITRSPTAFDPNTGSSIPVEITSLSLQSSIPDVSISLHGITPTVTGSTQVQFIVTALPGLLKTSPNTWHFLSSPLSGAVAGSFSGGLMNRYDEPTQSWVPVIDPATPLEVTRGYSVAMPVTAPVTLTGGQLNSGDFPVSGLTYTSGGNPGYVGWHLRGNPFSSAVKWDQGNWNRSNVDNAVYTFDGVQYVSYVPGVGGTLTDGILPALQGFMVHVTSAGPASLTIPEASRLQSNQGIYKSETENLFDLKISGNQYHDKTIIHFTENATNTFDPEYDAYKLFGIDAAPQLYSILPDARVSINSLPSSEKNPVIPLGIKVGAAGEYALSFSDLNTGSPETRIYLEDISAGKTIQLTETPYYLFTASPGDNEHRFNLNFHLTGTEDIRFSSGNVRIHSLNGNLFVNLPEPMHGEISLYTTIGSLISTATLSGNANTVIHLSVSPGLYVAKIVCDKGVYAQKVLMY